MRGSGLRVQLSSRQGERGAGQLEEEGRGLRCGVKPHRERQTGKQTKLHIDPKVARDKKKS